VHVIKGADRIQVKTADGASYQAVPVAASPTQDLALIKLQTNKTFPTAVLGDADKVRVGSWAIAVGSPFGFAESVTVGVISGKGRIIGAEGQQYRDLLQTDASVNRGNSGGPLLNLRGEVIGINQAIYSPSGVGNIGISFAIPMNAETRKAIMAEINKGQ
jgi:serine protease Do